MAVKKRICQGCRCTICEDSIDVCPMCGSVNIKAEEQSNLEGKTKCGWCGKLFTKTHHLQKYCPGICRQKKEYAEEVKKKGKKPLLEVVCKFCGKKFKQSCIQQYVCSSTQCQRARINKGRMHKKEELGPEFPDMPMRKCHTCGKPTYDYWCDRCRGYYRAANGVTGLSGTGELFAGALIDDGRV